MSEHDKLNATARTVGAGLERDHGLTTAGAKYAQAFARYRLRLRPAPPEDTFTGRQGAMIRAWVDDELEPTLKELGYARTTVDTPAEAAVKARQEAHRKRLAQADRRIAALPPDDTA